MTEHARIRKAAASRRSPARASRRKRRSEARYFAFLSYSHKDSGLADWLHRQLEQFRVPSSLVGRISEHGAIPRRLTPIFRDERELAAATDLGEEIEEALRNSQFLIVLCSPAAARSRWTNAEIDAFKRTRPDGCILAAIAAGEPFASDSPDSAAEECFPPALRHRYDRLGRPTAKRAEPLAADLRGAGEARRIGFLKLVAGMLGVGLDDLVQREATQRQRRLGWLAAASIAGMALTSTLALTAIQARDAARDERREAEGLVAFMLGDLKGKLEPIGKLDALDGVGQKVLEYYRGQDASGLSDSGLMQRSQALSLTAQVAFQRGNLNAADKLFQEAMKGTEEAIRRAPDDPQRLFDHAQSVFHRAQIAAQTGRLADAERGFREYHSLADRMAKLQPHDLRWRMEVQYGEANLGFILLRLRRFPESAAQFAKAVQTIEAVAALDEGNVDYKLSTAETLAWLADAEIARGNLAAATSARQKQVALLQSLAAKSGNVRLREKLIPAQHALGRMLAAGGRSGEALEEFSGAVAAAEQLMPAEPNNSVWLTYAANAHFALADYQIGRRNFAAAAAAFDRGCALASTLGRLNRTAVETRIALWSCSHRRGALSLAQGKAASALDHASQAETIARKIGSSDRAADSYFVARSLLLVGDAASRLGERERARTAWQQASALMQTSVQPPWERAVRAELLIRLGHTAQAQAVNAGLRQRGIINVEILGI